MKILKGYQRHDICRLLGERSNLVGIELGVAGGSFSKRMVESGRFKIFFGVDRYTDHHDTSEYVNALRAIGIYKNYKLFRMSFNDALQLFEDESLDFIYIDGYAHTGEDGGSLITEWYRKLKYGGVLSGDDYDETWPLVVTSVDLFSSLSGLEIHLTDITEEARFSRFRTWGFIKEPSAPNRIEFPPRIKGQLKLRGAMSSVRIKLTNLIRKWYRKFRP